jgi:hypothetical protein
MEATISAASWNPFRKSKMRAMLISRIGVAELSSPSSTQKRKGRKPGLSPQSQFVLSLCANKYSTRLVACQSPSACNAFTAPGGPYCEGMPDDGGFKCRGSPGFHLL